MSRVISWVRQKMLNFVLWEAFEDSRVRQRVLSDFAIKMQFIKSDNGVLRKPFVVFHWLEDLDATLDYDNVNEFILYESEITGVTFSVERNPF